VKKLTNLFETHSITWFQSLDNGQLIDADMDSIGIPTSMGIGKKPKEVLTISRQRAVWINHKKIGRKIKNYRKFEE